MRYLIEKYKKMPTTVKATFWFLTCTFLQRGISLITTPIFTRLLSASEYGEFNVFQSWLTILIVIVTLNLPWGVYPQGLVKFEENRDRFSSTLQGLLLFLVFTWTIVYLLFRDKINALMGMSTDRILAMLILMWTTSVFYFWSAYQRTDLKYKRLVVLTLIVTVLKPLLGIVLVITQPNKVDARIWGLVIVEILCYGWLFFEQLKKGKTIIDLKIWKYALAFNLSLIPHYLSQTILSGADRIMIERMISSEKSGIYSLAYSLGLVMLVFNSSLEQAINPWIYKHIKSDNVSHIKTVVYPAMIIVILLNTIIMFFAPEIVMIFAPVSYYEAIWIIPPVSMSVFFTFLYDMFANFEIYYEKTKLMSTATVLVAGLNIILNYVFIRKFGYYAAGYTTLFCYMCYAAFHYLVMRFICLKNKEQPYSFRFILICSLSFMCIGAIALSTYRHVVLRYCALAVIFFLLIFNKKKLSAFFDTIIKARQIN